MPSMTDIIGSNPLTQSMALRGIPLSALAQMSPAAANFQPDLQSPPPLPMPNQSPMSGMGQVQPQNVPTTPGVPPMQAQAHTMISNAQSPKPMTEAQSISQVLAERLRLLTDKEREAKSKTEKNKLKKEIAGTKLELESETNPIPVTSMGKYQGDLRSM